MKQTLNTIVFVLSIGIISSVMAEPTCVGGTIFTANQYGVDEQGNNLDKGGLCLPDGSNCNGHKFCRSNQMMNWWSAFTWCESNGRKLADLTVMCPGVPPAHNKTDGACPNLYGRISLATGQGFSSNKSTAASSTFSCVVTGGAQIDCSCCGVGYKTSTSRFAFCE